MNKIILIIFILFLINLFLFCLIISKINEILSYFTYCDLRHIHLDMMHIQSNMRFTYRAIEMFSKTLGNIAKHIYAYDEDKNEVTLV